MRAPLIKGFCFGLTSGIITTLGMIVGLNSGTHSRAIVLGGVLSIAIADSFSDALGIHISEESDKHKTEKEVWVATIATLVSKLLFSLTFVLPILLCDLEVAIKVSIVWGLSCLAVLSYYIARFQKTKPLRVIAEHLFIAILVIFATSYIGNLIAGFFN